MVYRLDAIAMLDEDRLKSFIWLQELQQRCKLRADAFSHAPKFERGQLVIAFCAKMFKKPRKLTVRWSAGPFWVYAPCGPTSFFLANLRGEVLPTPVNGFRMQLYYSKEPLQCPFPVSGEAGDVPAMMVSLMPISREVGSADLVLMGRSRAHLTQDMDGMQINSYVWGVFCWALHARLTFYSLASLLCARFSLLHFVCLAMMASPVQFQLLTPVQDLEWPATIAWLEDMRLVSYVAIDWATLSIHPQALAILQQSYHR